jgi:hypothetical protein
LNRYRTAWLRCEEGFVADSPLAEAELELFSRNLEKKPGPTVADWVPAPIYWKCSKPNGGKWSSIELLAAAIEAFSASYAAILGRRS